ncbi:SEC-C metal-binding domain-containing protein [Salinicoccus albus]|uniref:SEC-C metal-binding domain-containing protein n=1 Tax=Salinicoccus albus TaxID=418756 RepID=UPI00036F1C09|nr:SEC-C metal-binding domain-containing protein [Salinicoccus albus]
MASIKARLNEYNMNDLKRMARTLSVSNYSKFKKDELIDGIIEQQKNPESATFAYQYIDEPSFNSWKDASENGARDYYNLEEIFGLYIMGFAFEDPEHEDQFYITDTVKDRFAEVDTKENHENRVAVQRKLNLIRSALHLYGIVGYDQLIHLYKKYYSMDLTIDEITEFLDKSPYDVTLNSENQEIVIDDMNEEQYKMVRSMQGERPYYEPEFAKFIKFADPNYIDESENHQALKDWIADNVDGTAHEQQEVYIALLQQIMQGASREEIIKYLASLGAENDAADQQAFFDNIAGIVNHTRHFKYRGFKESELKTRTVVKEFKVGRNDPCPCGSGKKYKKCCGA